MPCQDARYNGTLGFAMKIKSTDPRLRNYHKSLRKFGMDLVAMAAPFHERTRHWWFYRGVIRPELLTPFLAEKREIWWKHPEYAAIVEADADRREDFGFSVLPPIVAARSSRMLAQ